MRLRPLLAAVTVAALLAACSTGTPAATTSTTSTSTTSTSSTTTTPAATSTSSTSTTSSTTTTVAPAAPCDTAPLLVRSSGGQGAAGTLVSRFVVKNTGSTTCTMQGYPFVAPFGPQQQSGVTVEADLPIKVGPIPASFGDIGGAGPLLQLAPGGTAVFFLEWTDVPSGTGSCLRVDGFAFGSTSRGGEKLVSQSFGSVCGGTMEESQMFPPSVTG